MTVAATTTVSAPGKIMLAGEYAVLHGSEAIMMAVDRRAVARVAAHDVELSPFLAAARDHVARERGADSAAARAAARIVVDSRALRDIGGVKLGLGSSAAVTVAAVGRALAEQDGGPPDPDEVHRLAHLAHGAAQEALGARGSGADVAASTHGGVIGFRPPNAVRPLALPDGLRLVFVWTGEAADTATLVAAVEDHRATDSEAHRRAADAITAAAEALAAARTAAEAVTAVADGALAVAELGRAAGVDLEIESHRAIARAAALEGGAAKPTGAGGGDVALAAFAAPDAAERFRRRVAGDGFGVLDLAIDPRGVSRDARVLPPSPDDSP